MPVPLSEVEGAISLVGTIWKATGATELVGRFLRRPHPTPLPANDSIDSTALLRQALTATDAPDDPLTGVWELFEWPVPANSDSLKGRLISSRSLTIFYRDRTDLSWHGIMTHTVDVSPREPEGPKSEPPFTAIYDVAFQKEKSGYRGSSKMSDKWYKHSTPKLEAQWEEQKKYLHKGNFEAGKMQGKGAAQTFSGRFETTRRSGAVSFRFERRQRWSQVQHLIRAGQ